MQVTTRLDEWIGAIHLHSTLSDGKGSVQRIQRVARRLQLDFCILTDHDTLKARSQEGYIGQLLFLVGSEVTCANDSHCLALGISKEIKKGLPPQKAIRAIGKQKGLSILAHPFDRGSPLFRTYYPWQDWHVEGYDALELWTFLVDWAEGITKVRQAVWGYLFPLHRLAGPNPVGLKKWDQLNRKRLQQGKRPLPVTGGVDAHGYFAYGRSLATILTHVWAPQKTGHLADDRLALLQAIRKGRSFVANNAVAPARGFRFMVIGRDRQYPETNRIYGPAQIVVQAPRPGRIRLLCDGEVIQAGHTTEMSFAATKSGTYRVEVDAGHSKPWIFSNPVQIINR